MLMKRCAFFLITGFLIAISVASGMTSTKSAESSFAEGNLVQFKN